MNKTGLERPLSTTEAKSFDTFRTLRRLRNHWSRPPGARSYYWYLTFSESTDLQELTERCQAEIALPYYDFVAASELHMTLDRIALEGEIRPEELAEIQSSASEACKSVAPFEIRIDGLGGTPGAIGFDAHPQTSIRQLRDTLRASTLSAYPNARTRRDEFHPHVTIAYCNADNVPAEPAIAAVERLNTMPGASAKVSTVTLVLLERRQRSYAWETIAHVPLDGPPSQPGPPQPADSSQAQ